MKLSWWVPVGVTVIIGACAGLNAYWSFRSTRLIYEGHRQESIEWVAQQFQSNVQNKGDQVASIAAALAQINELQQAFSRKNQDEISKLIKPIFTILKDRFNINVIQLTQSNAQVFYRAHHPDKNGDDASGRELISSTLQRKIPQSGIDAGSSGIAIRGILPVNFNGMELGLIEIGTPFNQVINSVADITGFDLGVYVDQKYAGTSSGRQVGEFKEIVSTNSELFKTLVPDHSMDLIQEKTVEQMDIHGNEYGVVKFPLFDFAKQNIGTVVASRSFELINKQKNTDLLRLVVQAILLTIIGSGVVSVTFYGLVMKPLRSLRLALDGHENERKELDSRNDEIGDLARKYWSKAS